MLRLQRTFPDDCSPDFRRVIAGFLCEFTGKYDARLASMAPKTDAFPLKFNISFYGTQAAELRAAVLGRLMHVGLNTHMSVKVDETNINTQTLFWRLRDFDVSQMPAVLSDDVIDAYVFTLQIAKMPKKLHI